MVTFELARLKEMTKSITKLWQIAYMQNIKNKKINYAYKKLIKWIRNRRIMLERDIL